MGRASGVRALAWVCVFGMAASLLGAHEVATVEQLVAAGQVTRATRKGFSDLLPIPPAPPGSGSLSEALQEMRDEERY